MKSTLKMLLPTTLPSARSASPPRSAALRLTASSGAAGAVGDHGEPDHQRRDAKRRGETRGAAHQQIGPERQQHEAEDEQPERGSLHVSVTAIKRPWLRRAAGARIPAPVL